ncbi:hypothetical protein FB384_004562 [Prauserella sediminis]|uniref:Acyl-protein synthetase LuxE domain-containing protein n=1 Tax=Prauserella sediminis TaxID=577680 RepID=A0A839XW39_9PSEU|nr:hypothetical protein [Prauserella sediminis]MBB3665604.1 hypothetical protein [Prauserella sediminis]
MGKAVDNLLDLADSQDRFDIPFEDLQQIQVEATEERFQERRPAIRLLNRRAEEAGLDVVRSRDDIAPLLFPHTAYKSYPESFLSAGRWDRLCRWLDTVSTHRVPNLDPDSVAGIDEWVEALQPSGLFVSCSSGTTGKSAMLVASQSDLDWIRKDTMAAFTWGSGIAPAQDRVLVSGGGATAVVPRNIATGGAYRDALADPDYEPFRSPMPPVTVGALTAMTVLRQEVAAGTAKPDELRSYEETSAERARLLEQATLDAADYAIAARDRKLHVSGMWSGAYELAKAVRDKGYSGKDFRPENSMYLGGGSKGADLPTDHREFVLETFNVAADHGLYMNYAMQELHTAMPRCREGGRYHVPPWVVPLVLDDTGETVLPCTGEVEGRAAFVDLSIDGRWGGVISGDKISLDFGSCACGRRGPSVRDNVTRYTDIAGDDKIGCAGTVDAYVRGIA